MKHFLTTLVVIFLSLSINAQEVIKLSDFNGIDHTNWQGKLTYKDYQSGKMNSIDTKMQLKIENDKITYNIQYVYEPKKNNKSSVKIKRNGTYFGNEKVISFKNENGVKTLVTSYKGKDNGRKANMYITRIITDKKYTETKKVQYLNTENQFVRNTYVYNKI